MFWKGVNSPYWKLVQDSTLNSDDLTYMWNLKKKKQTLEIENRMVGARCSGWRVGEMGKESKFVVIR